VHHRWEAPAISPERIRPRPKPRASPIMAPRGRSDHPTGAAPGRRRNSPAVAPVGSAYPASRSNAQTPIPSRSKSGKRAAASSGVRSSVAIFSRFWAPGRDGPLEDRAPHPAGGEVEGRRGPVDARPHHADVEPLHRRPSLTTTAPGYGGGGSGPAPAGARASRPGAQGHAFLV